MFEKLFGRFTGGNVVGEEQGNEKVKMMLKINAFSKVFPDLYFDEGNIDSIINKARLTQGEIDKVLDWAQDDGAIDFLDKSLGDIRDRVAVASMSDKPLE